MADEFTDRTKAITEFCTRVGFPAFAFCVVIGCVMWYASSQQEIEAAKVANQLMTAATDRIVAEAHVEALKQMSETASEQREDFRAMLEFTANVDTAHESASEERRQASVERLAMTEILRQIASTLSEMSAKNAQAQPTPGET